MLELMHYKGLLRVARREAGIRVYAVQEHGPGPVGAAARRAHLDRLVDAVVSLYSPVPAASLSFIVGRLRYATPHWHGEIKGAIQRAKQRFAHAVIDGHTWYWPAGETAPDHEVEGVRFLAPFDPVVWDRKRFELLWGWGYRFEAYTPAPKRKHGYYALPLLWRDRVIGWANVSNSLPGLRGGARAEGVPHGIDAQIGYISGRAPRDRGFKAALDAEIEAMRVFLGED
jgi:uncharacterized protein YcaQ